METYAAERQRTPGGVGTVDGGNAAVSLQVGNGRFV